MGVIGLSLLSVVLDFFLLPGTRRTPDLRADRAWPRFFELLRLVLRSFDPVHTGVDVAVVFLAQLPPAEAVALLQERRQIVAARRAQVAAELGDLTVGTLWSAIAADHLLSLIDAELAWLDRALARLQSSSQGRC